VIRVRSLLRLLKHWLNGVALLAPVARAADRLHTRWVARERYEGGDGREYLEQYAAVVLPYAFGRVLDLGCGHGYLTYKIACRPEVDEVVGIDKITAFRCPHTKVTYGTQDLVNDSSLPGGFDLILATEFIEHIPEAALLNLLPNIREALRDGGLFVGSTPPNPTAAARFSDSPFHAREYQPAVLRAYLERHFADVRLEQHGAFMSWTARKPHTNARVLRGLGSDADAPAQPMHKEPLVSIVMPVYNAARTIGDALRSLLVQTFERLEILVVDDGSVDASMDVVAAMADPRVKVLRQAHQGIVKALNTGCERSHGEFIARLDADDVAEERRVAIQVACLDAQPAVGLVGAWARIQGELGGERTFAPPISDQALRRYLLWDNPFVHSTVMFRRTAFQDAGGYPIGANEDYRLWIRIAQRWKLAVLPEVLVTHRVRSESLSRAMHRPEALRARLHAQQEAARALGPWHLALPALATTAGAYLLAHLGGGPENRARWRVRGLSGRVRGMRDASPEERSQ